MGNQIFRDRVINIIKKNDYLFFITKYWRLRFLMFIGKNISDETYIRWQYKSRTGKKLNLEMPKLYNEKVQYQNFIIMIKD